MVSVPVVEIRDVKVKLPSFLSSKRIGGRPSPEIPPTPEAPLSSPKELLDGSDALDESNAKVIDAPTLESTDDSSANDEADDSVGSNDEDKKITEKDVNTDVEDIKNIIVDGKDEKAVNGDTFHVITMVESSGIEIKANNDEKEENSETAEEDVDNDDAVDVDVKDLKNVEELVTEDKKNAEEDVDNDDDEEEEAASVKEGTEGTTSEEESTTKMPSPNNTDDAVPDEPLPTTDDTLPQPEQPSCEEEEAAIIKAGTNGDVEGGTSELSETTNKDSRDISSSGSIGSEDVTVAGKPSTRRSVDNCIETTPTEDEVEGEVELQTNDEDKEDNGNAEKDVDNDVDDDDDDVKTTVKKRVAAAKARAVAAGHAGNAAADPAAAMALSRHIVHQVDQDTASVSAGERRPNIYINNDEEEVNGSSDSRDMTVVTGNPSTRCSIDDWIGTKPTEDEVEEGDVELKPLEEKKTHENANRVGTVNAETSEAYEQMPIQLTKFIELASQSVDAIEKAVDTVFDTIEADTMIDNAFIDQFNERIDAPTLASPDDSSANDGQKTDSIALKSKREEKEEDTENVTEEMKNAEEDVDTAEGIIVDVIVKRNPKGKLLSFHPIKRIITWNKKKSSTKQAVSLEEEANSNSFNFNIIDEAAAIEMAMNDEEKEEDSQNVTEDMKNAVATEGIMNDTIAKTNPRGKLLAFQPVKRISTWNKKVNATVVELKSVEKNKDNENVKEDDIAAIVKNFKTFTEDDIASFHANIIDEAAAIEMTMIDEEKEEDSQNVTEDMKSADTPEGIMNDDIAKTNPKGKLLSFQPVKRISTWNKKLKTAIIELKTNDEEKEEKEEKEENVKEDDIAAIVKNFTEDDIAAIVKRVLNNNASLSELNRERSDATGSDTSASIAWIPSEDSFMDTDMNGIEFHNGKGLHDLSTFLHENQQVAYTMQNTLRLVYRFNEMAQCTANDIADRYDDRLDDATYNSSPCTTLFGCLDEQFSLVDNAVAPTKPVSILKKRSKSVKFRNNLPKKYAEEENYEEERDEGGMETGLFDRIGDTRDLAEL